MPPYLLCTTNSFLEVVGCLYLHQTFTGELGAQSVREKSVYTTVAADDLL